MRTKERIHPETGQRLVRGKRSVTLRYKGMKEKVEMPGWYAEDDSTGESGLHDARDMCVSDRVINRMKSREKGFYSPEEIHHIRKRKLGITQQQAGLLIGGGQNAFQKYESGEVIISKALNNLLKLLAVIPANFFL
ncbi:MAG: type II toxin-antitoxin system MqsA family antitoxin [Rhodobacteraceae bacterium]|nr:type II toxin-antitoxin system MqsA family antitoxin [Paracoccaceae bacterium]